MVRTKLKIGISRSLWSGSVPRRQAHFPKQRLVIDLTMKEVYFPGEGEGDCLRGTPKEPQQIPKCVFWGGGGGGGGVA